MLGELKHDAAAAAAAADQSDELKKPTQSRANGAHTGGLISLESLLCCLKKGPTDRTRWRRPLLLFNWAADSVVAVKRLSTSMQQMAI